MSDDDLQALPYRDLWLAELGATVPQYRHPAPRNSRDLPPVRPRHDIRDAHGRFAPDPTHDRGRA